MDNQNAGHKEYAVRTKLPAVAVVIGILLLVMSGVFFILRKKNIDRTAQDRSGKIRVVASFYPLADFAKNIGNGLVEVSNSTPAGAEPHDFEPSPQDIADIYRARLFIMNGNGTDAWAEKIKGDLEAKGVAVLRMSDNLPSVQGDPHFWLDPAYAEKETDLIADALIKIDSSHEREYSRNREAYKSRLAQLDSDYKAGLASCRQREFITAHNAFSYLASRYGLSSLYLAGLSPDQEPSPQTMAKTAQLARQKNIRYVFFETLVSPKLAETLAAEAGAQVLELNPIEGLTRQQLDEGKDYISVMRDNLANLKIALQCN